MITQQEVKSVLSCLNNNWESESDDTSGFYNIIHRFTEFTKNLIKTGNIPMVQQCFIKAELMINDGNQAVKNSIENIYVYSISTFLDMPGNISKQVKDILPNTLNERYHSLHHISYP